MKMPLGYIIALDEVFGGTYDVRYLEMELANRVLQLTEALEDMEACVGNHSRR